MSGCTPPPFKDTLGLRTAAMGRSPRGDLLLAGPTAPASIVMPGQHSSQGPRAIWTSTITNALVRPNTTSAHKAAIAFPIFSEIPVVIIPTEINYCAVRWSVEARNWTNVGSFRTTRVRQKDEICSKNPHANPVLPPHDFTHHEFRIGTGTYSERKARS